MSEEKSHPQENRGYLTRDEVAARIKLLVKNAIFRSIMVKQKDGTFRSGMTTYDVPTILNRIQAKMEELCLDLEAQRHVSLVAGTPLPPDMAEDWSNQEELDLAINPYDPNVDLSKGSTKTSAEIKVAEMEGRRNAMEEMRKKSEAAVSDMDKVQAERQTLFRLGRTAILNKPDWKPAVLRWMEEVESAPDMAALKRLEGEMTWLTEDKPPSPGTQSESTPAAPNLFAPPSDDDVEGE